MYFFKVSSSVTAEISIIGFPIPKISLGVEESINIKYWNIYDYILFIENNTK